MSAREFGDARLSRAGVIATEQALLLQSAVRACTSARRGRIAHSPTLRAANTRPHRSQRRDRASPPATWRSATRAGAPPREQKVQYGFTRDRPKLGTEISVGGWRQQQSSWRTEKKSSRDTKSRRGCCCCWPAWQGAAAARRWLALRCSATAHSAPSGLRRSSVERRSRSAAARDVGACCWRRRRRRGRQRRRLSAVAGRLAGGRVPDGYGAGVDGGPCASSYRPRASGGRGAPRGGMHGRHGRQRGDRG